MGKPGAHSPDEQVHAVLVHLRAHFNGALSVDDREDLAQSAYCELLEKERGGEAVEAPLALMKQIAWRDARDLLRDRREAATDPSAELFRNLQDPAPGPEARLLTRAALARALEALDQLGGAEKAAYCARVVDGLAPRQACLRLGLPRSTYCHHLKRAIDAFQATLNDARFRAVELTLLAAYIAGIASLSERRRAERLINADPHAAAVARRLRRLREGATGTHPAERDRRQLACNPSITSPRRARSETAVASARRAA